MEWWHAIVLGIVEGLTEYLPVSSTGHLILTQRALGIDSETAADAFAICIQFGAILAVLGIYFGRVRQMAEGALGRNPEGFRLGLNVVVAFLPAAFIGLLLEDQIKTYLFGGDAWGLWPTIAAWFVGGIVILIVAWKRDQGPQNSAFGMTLTELAWKGALVIGLIQCLAMWPGVSRSLVTILGGLAVGLSLAAAVEFAFLLGLLTLTAATAYDGLKHGEEMLAEFGFVAILLGLVAAWASAFVAVKWMVDYLNRHSLAIFGYYRIALAIVVTVLITTGLLTH
ncbi:MAG: undecaprenyl-diphosphate phosphatase [Chthoniobacterales bacterium]